MTKITVLTVPTLPAPSSPEYARVIEAGARAHGEISEPDHEVGDLIDALRACWAVMTPSQRQAAADVLCNPPEDWIREAE